MAAEEEGADNAGPAKRRSDEYDSRLFGDLADRLPNLRIRTIFDVGANVGQSAKVYRRAVPAARIWSFEPVAKTFQVLSDRFRSDRKVRCFHIALSDAPGVGRILAIGTSTGNRLLPTEKVADEVEEIELRTGDAFCDEHGVERIDLLKIDTEGSDLVVLKGFERMLSEQRVAVVQVEVGLNPRNRKHVSFEAMKTYLEARNYFLFHIYDQTFEKRGKPLLRRANPVFISGRTVKRNSPPTP